MKKKKKHHRFLWSLQVELVERELHWEDFFPLNP